MAKSIAEVLHTLVDEIDEGHGRDKGELHEAIRSHFGEHEPAPADPEAPSIAGTV